MFVDCSPFPFKSCFWFVAGKGGSDDDADPGVTAVIFRFDDGVFTSAKATQPCSLIFFDVSSKEESRGFLFAPVSMVYSSRLFVVAVGAPQFLFFFASPD